MIERKIRLQNNEFKNYFYYDETSPSFLRWKITTGKKIKNGMVAGSIDKSTGYFRVRFKGKNYRNSVIIYLLFNENSDLTNKHIDHIDGNRTNNCISNLRSLSNSENRRNSKMYSTNNTGITGVSEYHYFLAHWSEDGVPYSKMFKVSDYSDICTVKEECRLFRENKIQELNKKGCGYTDRHGK